MGTADGRAAGRALMSAAAAARQRDLHAWYGESHVLHGVDLPRRTAARWSRCSGATAPAAPPRCARSSAWSASAPARSRSTASRPIGLPTAPDRAPRRRLLPGGARHLLEPLGRGEPDAAAAGRAPAGMSVEEIYEMFPNLKERRAQPGHAPVGRRAADAGGGAHPAHRRAPAAARRDLGGAGAGDRAGAGADLQRLREQGYTIVMVEQNFRFAAPLADRFYVMEHGRIVEAFAAAELEAKMPRAERVVWASDGRTRFIIKENDMKLRMVHHSRSALRRSRRGRPAAGRESGRRGEDRRHRRHVRPVRRHRRRRRRRGDQDGDRRLRRHGASARRSRCSSADHQNKPDIGASKAREWIDQRGRRHADRRHQLRRQRSRWPRSRGEKKDAVLRHRRRAAPR